MSDLAHTDLGHALGKQVGPFPVGVWLVIVGGGLWFSLSRSHSSDTTAQPDAGDAADIVQSPDYGADTGGGGGGGGGYYPLPGTPVPTAPATPVATRTPAPLPATHPITALAPRTTTVLYYTVRSGDTLSRIAARYRKTTVWVYQVNKTVIENAAHAHHQASSRGGNLIYPGTRLRVR